MYEPPRPNRSMMAFRAISVVGVTLAVIASFLFGWGITLLPDIRLPFLVPNGYLGVGVMVSGVQMFVGLYGVIVVLRNYLQPLYGRKDIKRRKLVVRPPIQLAIKALHPTLAVKANRITYFTKFDEYREAVIKLLAKELGHGHTEDQARIIAQEQWYEIQTRAWHFEGEAMVRVFSDLYPDQVPQLKLGPKHDFQTVSSRIAEVFYDMVDSNSEGSLNEKQIQKQVKLLWDEFLNACWNTPLELPVIGIVSPVYKTPIVQIQKFFETMAQQTYPGKLIVKVVLNETGQKDVNAIKVGDTTEDSADRKWAIETCIKQFQSKSLGFDLVIDPEAPVGEDAIPGDLLGNLKRLVFDFIEQPQKGKRFAMEAGFQALLDQRVDFVYNIDSDTHVDIDALNNATRTFLSDGRIGCLTGDVRVSNPLVNLLTMLTYMRYFFAFNVERAAQSWFNAVTCMSGPFMGVRAILLGAEIDPEHRPGVTFLEAWASQTFLNRLCNFGDDRHIATLTLKMGYYSIYICEAIVWTDVPEQLPVWIVQQTRWSRSALRENIITLPWVLKLPLWVIFDITYQGAFPFIILAVLAAIIVKTVTIWLTFGMTAAGISLLPYIIITLTLLFVTRTLYGGLTNRDWHYVLAPLYTGLNYALLEWIRLYAIPTLNKTQWGTKLFLS